MMGIGLSSYIPIIIYITGIVALLFSICYKSEIGLYYLIPLIPLQIILEKIHPFPLGKDIIDIFTLGLLLCCFFKKSENEESYESHPYIKPIILYMILLYLYLWYGSFYFGRDLPLSLNNESLVQLKNHLILPALFFVTVKLIKKREQVNTLLILMLVSMLFSGIHYYRNYYNSSGHFLDTKRGQGIFIYLGPNEMAAFFSEYLFIVVGLFLLCKETIKRILLIPIMGFNLYAILFLFSRGAYLATIVGLLLVGLIQSKKLFILVLVLLLSWGTVVPQSVKDRIEMTQAEEGGFEASSAGRLAMWNQALNLFMKNPLGYGYNTTELLGIGKYKMNREDSFRNDTHNKYIEFALEMGIVGIVVFLYLFYRAFKSGWVLYKIADDDLFKGLGLGFALTVIATMVTNMFGDRWEYVSLGIYYWIFWALVVRAILIVEKEQKQINASILT